MQIPTINNFVSRDQNLMAVTDTKKYAEPVSKNSSEALKQTIENNSDTLFSAGSQSDSVVHSVSEMKQGSITEQSAATQHSVNKKEIENVPSGGASVVDIAEEAALSAIPIYGTVREFQKGNIGWGIFGIITDVLTLVPIVGAPLKAAATAIRGGETAVKAARAGLATTDAATKLTAEASASLAKSAEDTGKAALHSVTSPELLYESGTFAGNQTTKMVTDATSASVKSAGVLENAARWRELTSAAHASDTMNVLHKDLDVIKSAPELREKFISDFAHGRYKADDKIISGDNIFGTPYSDPRIKELISPSLFDKYIPQTVFNDSLQEYLKHVSSG